MIHHVFFWLKKDTTAEQRASFVEELALLPKIDYLQSGSYGKPAATEARPVVDHSYDFTLLLEFKTLADHEFYQKECPAHARFVERCRPLFEKVVIYDSEAL